MTELRWVKGEDGKKTLQSRSEGVTIDGKPDAWRDVPCAELPKPEKDPYWKCAKCYQGYGSVLDNFCSGCGNKRPELEPKPEEKRKRLADVMIDKTIWTFKEGYVGSVPLWQTTAEAVMADLEQRALLCQIIYPGMEGAMKAFVAFIRKEWLGEGGAE